MVEVDATFGQIEDDLTNLHEEVVFPASSNKLKSTRIYNEEFFCDFNLSDFPFDKQVCNMTFSLILQQAPVVKLIPNCLWQIPDLSKNLRVRIGVILVYGIKLVNLVNRIIMFFFRLENFI